LCQDFCRLKGLQRTQDFYILQHYKEEPRRTSTELQRTQQDFYRITKNPGGLLQNYKEPRRTSTELQRTQEDF